jgi:hypothetical protein
MALTRLKPQAIPGNNMAAGMQSGLKHRPLKWQLKPIA